MVLCKVLCSSFVVVEMGFHTTEMVPFQSHNSFVDRLKILCGFTR